MSRTRLRTAGLTSTLDLSGKTITNFATTGITADQLDVGQLGGRRNLIINGAMQVSQRGDFTTEQDTGGGSFTVDRWNFNGVASPRMQHLKDITVDGKVVNAYRLRAASSADGYIQAFQRIEDYKYLAGQVITISLWVRSNNVNARIRWHDGNEHYGTPHSGNGTWEKQTLTLTVNASISDYPYLLPAISDVSQSVSIAADDYIEFTMAQVELGSVATPFEHRSYGEELALCQRYYQFVTYSDSPGIIPGGFGGYSQRGIGGVVYPVVMRTTPTVVEINQAYNIADNSKWTEISNNSIRFRAGNESGDIGNYWYIENFKLDAEL